MELTATKVEEIFFDCFYRPDEVPDGLPPEDAILVKGIMATFAFHPRRTESHKDEIAELLNELPDQFKESSGGGWSFLNACTDRHGKHWGEHQNMEQLFVLGIAVGKAKFQLPKELWSALPGGMPYVVVLTEFKQPEQEATTDGKPS